MLYTVVFIYSTQDEVYGYTIFTPTPLTVSPYSIHPSASASGIIREFYYTFVFSFIVYWRGCTKNPEPTLTFPYVLFYVPLFSPYYSVSVSGIRGKPSHGKFMSPFYALYTAMYVFSFHEYIN